MEKTYFDIGGIPALYWGEDSKKVLLLVHGAMSSKEDLAIAAVAECAVNAGYRALSFDLPGHGGRGGELTPQTALPEIRRVYQTLVGKDVSLFGCSIGAYFAMLALGDCAVEQAMLLSPIVDLLALIEGMMKAHNIAPSELQAKRHIVLNEYESLDWDYYCAVKDNPLNFHAKTRILWGKADNMTSEAQLDAFAEAHGASVEKVDSEHYFHTEYQLDLLRSFIRHSLKK